MLCRLRILPLALTVLKQSVGGLSFGPDPEVIGSQPGQLGRKERSSGLLVLIDGEFGRRARLHRASRRRRKARQRRASGNAHQRPAKIAVGIKTILQIRKTKLIAKTRRIGRIQRGMIAPFILLLLKNALFGQTATVTVVVWSAMLLLLRDAI